MYVCFQVWSPSAHVKAAAPQVQRLKYNSLRLILVGEYSRYSHNLIKIAGSFERDDEFWLNRAWSLQVGGEKTDEFVTPAAWATKKKKKKKEVKNLSQEMAKQERWLSLSRVVLRTRKRGVKVLKHHHPTLTHAHPCRECRAATLTP